MNNIIRVSFTNSSDLQVLQDQGCPATNFQVREFHRLHPGGLSLHLHILGAEPVGNQDSNVHHHQLAVVQILLCQSVWLNIVILNTSRFPYKKGGE